MYIIADPADSSITISKRLYRQIHPEKLDQAKVLVFRLSHSGEYAFTVNPHLDTETQLADIQYNAKHQCIGFETLNPTVARILYDYNIPHLSPVKLSIRLHHDWRARLLGRFFRRYRHRPRTYYIIRRP